MCIEMENFPLDGCFPNDVTIHVKIFIYFLMKPVTLRSLSTKNNN